jgi:hypothetical protein
MMPPSISRWTDLAAALILTALIVVALAEPAYAQLAGGGLGGGGGGAMSQILQWVLTNIVNGIIGLAIIFVGVRLMMGHHTLAGIAAVAVGAIVVAQWQTIAGLFGLA